MANINLNVSPYFDDFDPEKDFLRVLFRPGFPVQARELSTLQSFIQEQISRFGNHVFKDGSRVTNAEITVATDVYRLSLTGSTNPDFPVAGSGVPTAAALGTFNELQGKVISNLTGSVRAVVVAQPNVAVGTATVGDLYIKYLTSRQFDVNGGYIVANTEYNPDEVNLYWNTYSTKTPASLVNVAEGVYYVQGNFSRVSKQTIVLSSTSQTPSGQIGFSAEDLIITQNEDPTILDNARGSSNEGAPGAHRLTQRLNFVVRPFNAAPDPNFYRLTTIENGVLTEIENRNPEYEELGRTLARRTYDESGNYAIRPFSHSIENTEGETFTLNVGASKAYVEGYEIDKPAQTKMTLSRGLDLFSRYNGYVLPLNTLTSLDVSGYDADTLPGFGGVGNDPGTFGNRLIFRNNSGDDIGVGRAWQLKGDRIYLYDIRLFQTLVVSGVSGGTFAVGETVSIGSTRGRVFSFDGLDLILEESSRQFAGGNTITGEMSGTTANVVSADLYTLSQTRTVVGVSAGGFSATSTGTVTNPNGSALLLTDRHIKTTFNESGNPIRNIVTTFSTTGDGTNQNGQYSERLEPDAQSPTRKSLRFAYLRIRNQSGTRTTSFGWDAKDREVSLHHPDIHRVYGINEGTAQDGDFSNLRFTRIAVSGAAIPQGSIIEGAISGTRAIVALSNTIPPGAGSYGGSENTHNFETGTRSTTLLEIIYTKSNSFTANETLNVTAPNSVEFNSQVTFTSEAVNRTGEDITDLFRLDNGQRQEIYDIGRLVREGETPAPNNDILVFYSYFVKENDNAYLSIDSYRTQDFLGVDVRFFQESRRIMPQQTDIGTDLRNAIDCRLVASNSGLLPSVCPFSFVNKSIENQTKVAADTQFIFDFDQYLARIDSIYLTKDGAFIIESGTPEAINPSRAYPDRNSMALFHIEVPPAVRYAQEECIVERVDNKRFTMRDIGSIENKINRLEEAVSLSLLESQALNDNVGDRVKSGFIVDDFSTVGDFYVGPADQEHAEYKSTINILDQVLQAPQTGMIPVPMEISSANGCNTTFFPGYVTRAFSEELMLEQPRATGVHLINPFATWVFNGEVTLTPPRENFVISVKSYFTDLFGQRTSFGTFTTDSGTGALVDQSQVAAFNNFQQVVADFRSVNTATPGGEASSRVEWFGAESRRRGRGGTEVVQAQRRIRTFNEPRALADANGNTVPLTETITGRSVITNDQAYWAGSVVKEVQFRLDNCRPNTPHAITFGGINVAEVTTDANGTVEDTFSFPQMQIHSGDIAFQARDASGGNNSNAFGNFESRGTRVTSEVVQRVGNRDVVNLGTSVKNFIPDPPPQDDGDDSGDPIAQTFRIPNQRSEQTDENQRALIAADFIENREKSIVTSIDLWLGFVDVRTAVDQIKVEIRDVVNGYPGGYHQILADTGWVRVVKTDGAPGTQTPDDIIANNINASTSTNFRFRKPVILDGDREYAIVIKTPSDSTSVYCATIGERLIGGAAGSAGIHSDQPNVGGHFGSFFVSQNQTTWTANQNVDLTFRLHRARFENSESTLSTASVVSDLARLGYNGDIGAFSGGLPIETFIGSPYVKVYHPNHGLNYSGANVVLSGFISSRNYNGIPGSELLNNGNPHDVLLPTLDSYFILASTSASASGRPGIPVNSANLPAVFATQSIAYDMIRTNLMPTIVDGDTVSANVETVETNSINLSLIGSTPSEVLIQNDAVDTIAPVTDENILLDETHFFNTPRILRNQSNYTPGSTERDLVINYTLTSGSPFTSPIIESWNLFPAAFRNLTGTFLTDSDLERFGTATDINSLSNLNFANYQAARQAVSENSAYVTKQIDLDIPADGLIVFFDADMEPGSSVEIAYKVRSPGDNTPFSAIPWQNFPAEQQITETNYGSFNSMEDFREYEARVMLPEFSSFKVRIRMSAENEAEVPRLRDLRVIADI